MNRGLRDEVRRRLADWKLLPQMQRARSSETHLTYEARIGTGSRDLPTDPGGFDAVRVERHESLLDHLVDGLELEGLAASDLQLRGLMQSVRERIRDAVRSRQPNELPNPTDDPPQTFLNSDDDSPQQILSDDKDAREKSLYSIVFAEQDPLRFEFGEDSLAVKLRVKFEPAEGETVPLQEISLRFGLSLTNTQLHFDPTDVRVRSVVSSDRSELIESTIQTFISSKLKRLTLPRAMRLPLGSRSPSLRIRSLTSRAGWLQIALDH